MCGYGLGNGIVACESCGDKLTDAQLLATGSERDPSKPHTRRPVSPLHLCQDSFGNWIVARCLVRGAPRVP